MLTKSHAINRSANARRKKKGHFTWRTGISKIQAKAINFVQHRATRTILKNLALATATSPDG